MGRHLLIFFLFLFLSLFPFLSFSQSKKEAASDHIDPINISVEKELKCFDKEMSNTRYCISLCGDVPQNSKPYKVAHHQQTGHVFLIIQKIDTLNADTLSQVFGFYPKRGLPTLFFKSIKGVVKDNSAREHDVSVTRILSQQEFDTVRNRIIQLSKKIYHINKYNCYDFAVLAFNTGLPNADTVPITHVRFPFIFGKGGSPAGLYRDLEKMKNNGSSWADMITLSQFIAPVSSTRDIKAEKSKSKKN